MTSRVAIYARASPDCPISAEEQSDKLKAVAIERGWAVAHVFVDRPTSAKVGLDRRTGQIALVEAIRSGTIAKVLLSSVCRIGKSLVELVGFMDICRATGVSIYLHEQGTDTDSGNGMSLLDLSAMMAFHLRQSRRDAILRGQAAARSLDIRFGRPPLGQSKVDKARIALAAGQGIRQVARFTGISPASASRLKNSMSGTTTDV